MLGFALVILFTPDVLRKDLGTLFAMAKGGRLRIQFGGRIPVANAAQANRALESRRTVGKLVLVP